MPEQGSDILAHFGEDHFLDRYERFQAHIAEWRQQYPHLASVDLRYDNQVVLQMASGKQTSDPSAGADSTSGSTSANSPAATDQPKPQASTPAPRRTKPAQRKKHAAVKRASIKLIQRSPASTPRPAAATALATQQGGQ
jgi:cell division protein FtsQ